MKGRYLIQGDIAKVNADAIVTAANARLMGGSGVDGAIHKAGGPKIMIELDEIRAERGILSAGDAVVTDPGDLNAKILIHAVGPVWHNGESGEAEELASCYRKSLTITTEFYLHSIAFPAISTGAYGYPKEQAAEIAIRETAKFPDLEIIFVVFDAENHSIYSKLLEASANV